MLKLKELTDLAYQAVIRMDLVAIKEIAFSVRKKKKNTRRHQARKIKPQANSVKDQVKLKETLALVSFDDVSDDTGEDSKRRCATTEPVHQASFGGKNFEKEMSFS